MTATATSASVETPLTIVEPEAHWEDITPERARELLSQNQGNRNLRTRVVAAYARDLQQGRWQITGEAIKLDWTGRLIDGQHRLAAIDQTDTTIRTLVVTGLDPAVQRVIDVNIRRTAADTLGFLGVERNVYEVASSARIALAWDRGSRRYGTIPYQASHAEIFAWVEAHEEINEAVALARRIMNRLNVPPSPLGFAIWKLSQVDAQDALEFFTSTAEYATTGEGDPRATLLRVLNNGESRLARRPLTLIGLTFAAWNAWRDGQKITTLPLVDGKGNALTIQEPV